MKTSDFYYDLPERLIAQSPIEKRDESRLMLLERATGRLEHRRFNELPELLCPGDLLVLNDTRVLPARLYGVKHPTGAAIQFLLLERRSADTWEVLVKPGRRAKPGTRVVFGEGLLEGEILEMLEGGNRLARFRWEGDFYQVLERIGQTPLPHYITKALADSERYQTVYASESGSAAAPTAGLHFTPELLDKLRGCGISTAFVTLHVGLGTFRPVTAADLSDHKMHSEPYVLPAETAALINRTKASGGRVIAVGTTGCRTLESVWQKHGKVVESAGRTDLFLTPGSSFGVVDGLITNFHLPESTLIMLVAAFAGYDVTMNAYRTAVQEEYRVYSFGDAMLII